MNEAQASCPAVEMASRGLAVASERASKARQFLPMAQGFVWSAAAVAAFHLAYAFSSLNVLIIAYALGLAKLTAVRTWRQAGYLGFLVGLLTAAPQLTCFWTIFGRGALALWSILGFWIGSFVVLGRLSLRQFGLRRGMYSLPFLWTGLEYFRSELYPLKFSWLTTGYALSGTGLQPLLHFAGVYGAGFLTMALAVSLLLINRKKAIIAVSAIALLSVLANVLAPSTGVKVTNSSGQIAVAGVQLEFPAEFEVIDALDRLIAQHPQTELLILSEYTFINEGIPRKICDWCREHHRYLLVGGKDPAASGNFYDTAFVVAPNGEIVFKQAKCVPVQFMKDGLPARQQQLWDSPWGKLGVCICYDLSYTRVTDRLVRLGAQALLVPTMDLIDWGRHEHELHARVAPARASEYGLPVFRVGSSGISQFVDRSGRTIASASFPGNGEQIFGKLLLGQPSHVPVDRWLAWICLVTTGGLIVGSLIWRRTSRCQNPQSSIGAA